LSQRDKRASEGKIMVWWWWIIPGVLAVIGLAFALSGLGWMFRGRPVKGGRGVVIGAVPMTIGAVIALLGLNIQTYHRLGVDRQHIATLEFTAKADQPQSYLVEITEYDENGQALEPRTYDLSGDEWMLRSRVIRWKPWATVLGLDAQYRLESLDGTYRDPDQRRTTLPTVVDLRPTRRTGVDFYPAARAMSERVPLLNISAGPQPGEAIYWPIAHNARYEIFLTAQGDLRADPEGTAAVDAVNQWGATRVRVEDTRP
jgi:hypothetical protein